MLSIVRNHPRYLVDYLNNNLLIAHYCGFDITAPLPSYWTFDRFLKNFDHSVLSSIMESQVLLLASQGIVDTSFIGLDSTPVDGKPFAFHHDESTDHGMRGKAPATSMRILRDKGQIETKEKGVIKSGGRLGSKKASIPPQTS